MSHKLSRKEVRAVIEGRNPKAGSEAETIEESSLLVCFQAQIQLPAYPTEDNITGGGTTHSETDLPSSIATEKNLPRDTDMGQSDIGNFSTSVPSSYLSQPLV